MLLAPPLQDAKAGREEPIVYLARNSWFLELWEEMTSASPMEMCDFYSAGYFCNMEIYLWEMVENY